MQGPSKPPTHLFNASYTQPQIYFYSYQVSNQQPRVIAPFEVSNSQQQRPPQVNTYPIYAYPNQQIYVAAPIVAHNQNLQQQQVQQNPMKPSPNPETKEDEEDERLTEFRALKVFPLFGDRNIAKFSCNYHLYFELFRKSIRLCIVLLVFSGIVELVLMFLKKNDNWVYAGYQLMVYLIIMLVTLIVYILMWRREQGLFAKDEILQDLQWTENMFAVRIKGLQKTVKKEDIIVHINGVLKRRPNLAASGYVKDVIFLHDLAEYNKLQKKIKEARAKINTIGGLEGEYNNSKIVEYGERERAMELEILRGKYFKGKAIIILNSIGAKVALLKWYESRAWSSSSSPAPLSANKFILRECEEPGDIKYENLHYPKCSKMIRHGIAFVLSKLTLYIGFLILFIYNMAAAVRSNDTDQTDTDKTGNAVAGIFFAIIDMGFGALYGVCQGTLYISKSDTTSDMKKLTYSIVSSALIEGFVQGISIGLTYSIWSFEYIYIPAVIFGKRILFILISFLLNIEFFTDLIEDYKFSNGLAVKVATYFRKITTSFDVISGTENITGVLYLAFAFLARSPLLILPVTIVILLLSAVIEKYILINYSEEITKRKSPYLMTKTYRILHHGCLVIMLGTLSNLIFIDEGLPGDITYNEYKIWTYIAFGTIGVGILVFFFFGKYVFSFDLMENLYKTRRDVEYDQVSKNFFLTFSNTNPGSLISQKYAKPLNP